MKQRPLFVLMFVLLQITLLSAQEITLNNSGKLILKYDDNSFRFIDIKELDKDFLKTIDNQIVKNYFISRSENFLEQISESKYTLELELLYKGSTLEDLNLDEDENEDEIEQLEDEIKSYDKQLDHLSDLQENAQDNLSLVQNFPINKPKKMASMISKYLKNEITLEEWGTLYKTDITYKDVLNEGFTYQMKEEENKTKSIKNENNKEIAIVIQKEKEVKLKAPIKDNKDKESRSITDIPFIESPIIDTLKTENKSHEKGHQIVRFSNSILPQDKIYKSINPENNVIVFPPKYDCPVVFDGKDELSGKMRKDLGNELIFTYTPDNLKPILKDEDYMICTGHMSKVTGGFRFLFMEIKIKSKNANIEYGRLEKGNMISVKLLNGKTYKIRSGVFSVGIYDKKTGLTTYKTQYKLTSDLHSRLTESPLDKMRIVWSTGYEDYEIYEIDFLINQLNCL